MKITLYTILVLCCFWSASVMAQSRYGIKGAAADTASKIKLPNTSVVILNAKDSTLRAFTRAGADGSFAIAGLN
jgi:hypothetical protein